MTVTKIKNPNLTFLTPKGLRKPDFVWSGSDSGGGQIMQPTRKEAISAIEMNNRLLAKNPNYFNQL
jgi:hypothetical protein